MATDRIEYELIIKDQGTATLKKFARDGERAMGGLGSLITSKIGGAFRGLSKLAGGALSGITRSIFSLKGAIAGLGLGFFAKSVLDTASGFEQMKLSLDTITKGEGEAWFKRLNEWALKMPINTEKAIESFTKMRAMGLNPTIEQMTTLVDTVGALGGTGDNLLGISRALGQIQTKGKVSTEELLQLAEQGVPVFEILREKMGLTQEQLSNIGKAGLDVGQTLDAIFAGLKDRFEGQSTKQQGTWGGMVETMKSYWKEFSRLVMESGPMEWLKERLGEVVSIVDEMYKSGQLQAWAEKSGAAIVEWFGKGKEAVMGMFNWTMEHMEDIKLVLNTFGDVAKAIAGAFETVGKALGNLAGWIVEKWEWVATKIQGILAKIESWMEPVAGVVGKYLYEGTARYGEAATPGAGSRASMTGMGSGGGSAGGITREGLANASKSYPTGTAYNMTINLPEGGMPMTTDNMRELAKQIAAEQRKYQEWGIVEVAPGMWAPAE